MSEIYDFTDNDLIPDCELEIMFDAFRIRTNKNNKKYILVIMKVRNDINENGVFKNKTIYDTIYQEKDSERFIWWKVNAIVKTQDLSQVVNKETKTFSPSIEEIMVFLTGKNARVHIAIESGEYGNKNVVKKYLKSQYIPKKVEPIQVEQQNDPLDIDFDDLPF